MNLDKLKESARRFEQKEDWRRAIEVYQRALGELEAQGDHVADPGVYNRVGDLQMKVAETSGAVRSYEQALELYAEQGFFNNAIALGGKILRVEPGRTATYLRLAQLHARKDVIPEVRRHLAGYLKGMRQAHRAAEAVGAMRDFVDRHCRNAEMRAIVTELLADIAPGGEPSEAMDRLVEELRTREAVAGARSSDHEAPPQVRGLVFLDTNADWSPSALTPSRTGGAVIEPVDGLTTIEATLPSTLGGLPLIGLESSEFAPPDALPLDRVSGMELDEVSFKPGEGGRSTDLLIDIEAPAGDPAAGLIGEAPPTEEFSPTRPGGAVDDLAIEIFDRMDSDDLVVEFLPDRRDDDGEGIGGGPTLVDLDEPDGSSEETEAPGAATAAELEGQLARHEAAEEWDAALAVAGALVRLEPDQIPRYQKQVELAYRSGDTNGLTQRYLELGDALLRAGMRAPAVAVYRRVLEHEPGHSRAMGALASLGVSMQPPPAAAPPTPPAAHPTHYVDLGALILDDQPERDSRMRVDAAEPSAPEDEDATFQEILSQFKRGIEANLDSEDFQAHYDLGIAFKEMGLLDEAIAQFQRALRAPDGRLRASEALGIAFFEKGRHAIAEAVLSRAIAGLPGADDEKIGLIYWLGRALEALGREAEALPCYERALAVDIRFLDVTERIGRLGAERPA